MTLAIFDANTATRTQLRTAMETEGYVILRNVLNKEELSSLRAELEPYFSQRETSKALFFGFNTKRIEALFAKSGVVRKMGTHETILDIVNHVLGANCDSYQINLTQGIRINPGEKAQIIHPDSALFPISNKPFEFVVNALWAYSDFTFENGATQIVPGSHRWDEGRQPMPHEIKYAEMPAGSVLLYAASLLHGGGANITEDETRTGIAISYCLGWLRQSENQYLSYSLDVVKSFPPELQHLIGYNVHRPNLGWVHGHNPADLLNGADMSGLGAEDFLTPQQQELMREYHRNAAVALTSHNLAA